MTVVIGPPEPAHWEGGRYVTNWVRCVVESWGSFGPTYCAFDRRWVRTENGWDEEIRELWESLDWGVIHFAYQPQ